MNPKQISDYTSELNSEEFKLGLQACVQYSARTGNETRFGVNISTAGGSEVLYPQYIYLGDEGSVGSSIIPKDMVRGFAKELINQITNGSDDWDSEDFSKRLEDAKNIYCLRYPKTENSNRYSDHDLNYDLNLGTLIDLHTHPKCSEYGRAIFPSIEDLGVLDMIYLETDYNPLMIIAEVETDQIIDEEEIQDYGLLVSLGLILQKRPLPSDWEDIFHSFCGNDDFLQMMMGMEGTRVTRAREIYESTYETAQVLFDTSKDFEVDLESCSPLEVVNHKDYLFGTLFDKKNKIGFKF